MIDHFDIIAPLYDRLIRLSIEPELVEILKLPVQGRFLDAGGGTGRVSGRFVEHADQVVVCDFSSRMLKQAKRKNGLQVVRASVDRLPFPDESCDRILVVDALHQFKQPGPAVTEFARVLKKGGRLVIEDFDIDHLGVKLLAWGEKLALMGSQFFNPGQIADMNIAAGLRPEIIGQGKASFWVAGDKL